MTGARRGVRPLLVLGLALAVALGLAGPALAAPTTVAPGRQAEEDPPPDADDPPPPDEAGADDGAPDPFDKLASCVGAEGRLLVVLLVDESASLRETDPDDQRIAAARAALRSIDLLRGTAAGGGAVEIDLLVSTFSFDFQPVGVWTPLTSESRAELDERIASLAERDASMDTDFHNALSGARQELAARATESAAAGTACKSILLFTDGNFTLGARETAEQREQFGTTKDYAPGIELTDQAAVDEVTRRGTDALCEPDGVADQVRADNITVISVPLGEGSGLLQAITTGRSDGGGTCGDPDTDVPGAYLPASDTQELIRTFDFIASRIAGGVLAGEPARPEVCPDDACEEGAVTFTVASSLARVHVFVAVPDDETRIVLAPPDGDALEVVAGEDDGEATVADAPVTVATIADQAVTLDLEVPSDGTADGVWTVTLVGGEGTGTVQVLTFTDLVAVLSESALVIGEEGTIGAVVQTRDGEAPTAELTSTEVRATLTDPILGTSETIDLAADGDAFAAAFTVDDDVTAAAYSVTFALDATTASGAAIRSVSPDQTLAIRRPPTYPQLAPPTIDLSSIDGDGLAEGLLLVQPPAEGEGCAWFDEAVITSAPGDAGVIAAQVDALGTSADDCTPITALLEVPVILDPESRASGTVNGHLRVQLATGPGEDPIPTDVPLTFEMSRGVDEAKRIALAVALMVGGLVVPLFLLVVVNLLTTRFQDLDDVRAAWVPVVISSREKVLRAEGRVGLTLRPTDFAPIDADWTRGSFTWNGLVFRARTPANPFGEPYASVVPEGGAADVAREGRRTDLALGLAGSWMFVLDQDASRSGEVHGVVVAFAAADGVAPQASRLADEVSMRAPRTARRLAELAGIGSRPS